MNDYSENIAIIGGGIAGLSLGCFLLRKDINRIINIILSEISNALYRDMAVEIRQFGRFSDKNQKARISRNPKSGIKISIPA